MRINASMLVAAALWAGLAGADEVELKLDAVAAVHGEPGAWAVAGWRMGEAALKELGLKRGAFALAVEHRSPKTVRYACIADGVQAATGASLGRLQLSLTEVEADKLVTVFTNKETGKSVKLRPTAAFIKRFMDVPRERARAAGREVMTMGEAGVFEVVR